MELKKSESMMGACDCLIKKEPMECCGDYLGGDSVCDNPFGCDRKMDVKDCEEKGVIKIRKNKNNVVEKFEYC